MNESVQYDAALAAGLLIMELVDSSPASPSELLQQIVFVVLQAIDEAARRQENRHAEPSVN